MPKSYEQSKADGVCWGCGEEARAGRIYCEECGEKKRRYVTKRRADMIAAGRCPVCGRDALENSEWCEEHYFRAKARSNGKSAKWTDLRDLFYEQGGMCAYTNEKLTLGVNASIDHKIPRCQGGGDDKPNLQWTTWAINLAKHKLTEQEFIAMCKKVAERN